jgi:murein DD-endopeptidase MepM/ murein hydrolase activator NlpD
VPYGTPVLAVEDGRVIQVWEPSQGGGCDRKYNDVAHNIKILGTDGGVTQYVHIKSKVHIGEVVKRGQIIAVTANNGFHCVPQLHFNLFRDERHTPESGKPETTPVLFDGLPDGIASEGYIRHK